MTTATRWLGSALTGGLVHGFADPVEAVLTPVGLATAGGSIEGYCATLESRSGPPISLQGMATPPRVPQP